MKNRIILASIISILILSNIAYADFSNEIPIQGRLLDVNNIPISGQKSLSFTIFDASTGGNQLFTETISSVTVTNGLFSVILGEDPNNPLNLDFSQNYYVEISVNGETLSPRQKLLASPYAISAQNLEGAAHAVNGNIGIGTDSPLAKLDIWLNGTQPQENGQVHGFRILSSDNQAGLFTVEDAMNQTTGERFGVVLIGKGNNQFPISLNTDGNSWINGGNVGIGTSTPAQKLDVAGNVKAVGVCLGDDCRQSWPTSSSSYWIQNGNNIYYENGNVGIGTTLPTQKLDVAGTTKVQELCIGNDCRTSWPTSNEAVPPGTISFFNAASCPTGWSEVPDTRGRYLVGLPIGGTLAGTQGTALTNLENRPVGQHSHTGTALSAGAHTHTINDPSHSHGLARISVYGSGTLNAVVDAGSTINTGSSTTGISINSNGAHIHSLTIENTGSVTGTNAPYVQYLVCQKDGEYFPEPSTGVPPASGIQGHLLPSITGTYDIGSIEKQWRYGYYSNNLIIGDRSLPDLPYTQIGSNDLIIGSSSETPAVARIGHGNSYFMGGNVGIGTATPGAKLNVVGGDIVSGNISGNNIAIGTTNIQSSINGDPSTLSINSLGGNVGIGTSTPSAKLHIGGTPGVDGIKFPDNTVQTSAAKRVEATQLWAKPAHSSILHLQSTIFTNIPGLSGSFITDGGELIFDTSVAFETTSGTGLVPVDIRLKLSKSGSNDVYLPSTNGFRLRTKYNAGEEATTSHKFVATIPAGTWTAQLQYKVNSNPSGQAGVVTITSSNYHSAVVTEIN